MILEILGSGLVGVFAFKVIGDYLLTKNRLQLDINYYNLQKEQHQEEYPQTQLMSDLVLLDKKLESVLTAVSSKDVKTEQLAQFLALELENTKEKLTSIQNQLANQEKHGNSQLLTDFKDFVDVFNQVANEVADRLDVFEEKVDEIQNGTKALVSEVQEVSTYNEFLG